MKTNIFILAVGNQSGDLLCRLSSQLSAPCLSILSNSVSLESLNCSQDTLIIAPIDDMGKIDETTIFPLLPDWEKLQDSKTLFRNELAQASRFGSRLAILDACNQTALKTAISEKIPENTEWILVLADLSDSFASGILWDCLAATKKKTGHNIPVIGLLGLPLQDQPLDDRPLSRSELYAALKELNFLANPQGESIGFGNHLMDRVVFFDNKYMPPSNSIELETLFQHIHIPEVAEAWTAAMSLSETTSCFNRRYPVSAASCEQQMAAFSFMIPVSWNPSLLAETFQLQLAGDVLTCLASTDGDLDVRPEDFLHPLGLSHEILLKWVDSRVKELLESLSSPEALSINEFVSFCLRGQNRIFSIAAEHFQPMLSRKDMPGLLGKETAELLSMIGAKNAGDILNRIAQCLSDMIDTFKNDVYRSQQTCSSLETAIREMAAEKTTSQDMIRDHLADKFLPGYTAGISHSDMEALANERAHNIQRNYMENQFEFMALSQCLIYLECLLEDIRNFIKNAMDVRLAVLQKAASAVNRRIQDHLSLMEEMGMERQNYHDACKSWFASLAADISAEALAQTIRNIGMENPSGKQIFLRHLEQTYSEPFTQALMAFVNKSLLDAGPKSKEIIYVCWLKYCMASRLKRESKDVLSISETTQLLPDFFNLQILPQEFPALEISDAIPGGDSRIIALAPDEFPLLCHFQQGIPLSYLNGIQRWFLDYQDAIFEEQPVHVIKSLVYMGEAWIPQRTASECTPHSLFWMALTLGVLEENAEKVSFPSRRACYWNILWTRSENAPIWLSQQEMIQIMNQNSSLCQEIAERIEGVLTRPPYENQESRQISETLLKNDRLQAALQENPTLKSEIIGFIDRIFCNMDQTALKNED